jgi:hypothetical protein
MTATASAIRMMVRIVAALPFTNGRVAPTIVNSPHRLPAAIVVPTASGTESGVAARLWLKLPYSDPSMVQVTTGERGQSILGLNEDGGLARRACWGRGADDSEAEESVDTGKDPKLGPRHEARPASTCREPARPTEEKLSSQLPFDPTSIRGVFYSIALLLDTGCGLIGEENYRCGLLLANGAGAPG